MERLRYLARSSHVPQQLLVEEAAGSLASFADEHHSLVMACRQMLAHHPSSGPLTSLACRLLTSPDPRQEAWEVVDEVRSDCTTEHLVNSLPSPTNVFIDGWSEHIETAAYERPDLALVHEVEEADIMLVDTCAGGPHWFLAERGIGEQVHQARDAGVQRWAIAAFGSILPKPLFDAAASRSASTHEVLELSDFDRVICPDGMLKVTPRPLPSECPLAAELT